MHRAEQLDQMDALRLCRDAYQMPANAIYLCGHSLGALHKEVHAHMDEVIEKQWGQQAIMAWSKAEWINLPARLGDKIGQLVGAESGEVIVADSLSVNLFKLIVCTLKLRRGRNIILTEEDNFPADLYIADGIAECFPHIRVVRCKREDIARNLNQDVALLMLSHVNYRTSAIFDMQKMTALAHASDVFVLFDLAHSAGIMPLYLSQFGVDFAVGCSYKYLHGGPGAPGFLYVAKRHQPYVKSPLLGWMGHAAPFTFSNEYVPAADVRRFLCGTPPILSMAALERSIDYVAAQSLAAMADKNNKLADYMIAQMRAHCPEMVLISPLSALERGGHLGYMHEHAYALQRALLARGVIVDYRAPNLLRFGLSPLCLSFVDIHTAVETLAHILHNKIYLEAEHQKRGLLV